MKKYIFDALSDINCRVVPDNIGLTVCFNNNIEPDWVIMNVSRPLTGKTLTDHGPFIAGRFFVAIDVHDSIAEHYIFENKKLGASVISILHPDIIDEMALSLLPEEYHANFKAMIEENPDNKSTLLGHYRDTLNQKTFAEIDGLKLMAERAIHMAKQGINSIEDKINYLHEEINAIGEQIGERLTQYQSEVGLYGDAGPGQHPSLWQPELEYLIKNDQQSLERILSSPEGMAFLEKEKAQNQCDDQPSDDFLSPF